ncbi:uncharacterized protein NEMAJ01_1299 [Nematocida major]|uniref:uncharacterized protein n=1 Tax=Nematocida major TaxID=1912982 RepID=UPI0020084A76|nr:uncharacterized protein NEMAJ01_1299 [Nematocida major]KAH9386403.1 hypothetical protein NEMAJ01_1299 [Nematocida major]
MEFVLENLWYIDNQMCEGVCQDAMHTVHIIPKAPVPYSVIFAQMETFDKFYSYAHGKRDETKEKDTGVILASIYDRLLVQNATMADFIKGFKASRALAESKRTSYVLERMKKDRKKPRTIKEGETDKIFLDANNYLAQLKPAQFYKMECGLARHFFARNQLVLAYRFAKEALEMASRSASAAGIEESRALLIEVENRIAKEKEDSRMRA